MARTAFFTAGVFTVLALATPTPAGAQCHYQTLDHHEFLEEARFGYKVAVDGGTAAITSFRTHSTEVTILERGALAWELTQVLALPPQSAGALALQGDTLLIQSRGQDYGYDIVQVFERQAGTWTWVQDLSPEPASYNSNFGRAIALDGDVAVVGAPAESREGYHAGAAYVFERQAGTWIQTERLGGGEIVGFLGYAVSVRGDVIALGEPKPVKPTGGLPILHVYWRNAAGEWILQQRWEGPWSTRFGTAVVLSPLGQLLVGAPDRNLGGPVKGSVFVYEEVAGSWILDQELTTESSGKATGFGSVLAADGERIVVGTGLALLHSGQGHGVHVFERVAGAWSETLFIASPAIPEPNEWKPPKMGGFGHGVVLGPKDLFVSAPTEDFAEADRGAVHVYALEPDADNYCGPANLNSSGTSGTIAVAGCPTLLETTPFGLSATGLPANEVGFFLGGFTKGFVANVGGSQGNLCIASPLRFDPPVTTGAGGESQLAFDLYPIVFKGGATHWPTPGESLVFQLWFRDKNPGPTSNLTDGLAVTFK